MDFLFLLPLLATPVVFLLIGGKMLGKWRGSRKTTALMRRTQTIEAARVPGIPPGELVEVEGALRCDSPLTSETAKEKCAYHRNRTMEVRRKTHSENRGSQRYEQTVFDKEHSTPFFVEDATGRVRVVPEGAEVDAKVVVDRFEEANEGLFSNKLGERYVESILPVDAPVYVLGVVGPDGFIVASPPENEGQRFMISHRTEGAMAQSRSRSEILLGFGAGCFLVAGAASLLVSLTVLALLLAG